MSQINAKLSNLIKNYQPTEATKNVVKSTTSVFLVGITGAGKDTIKQKLLETDRFYHLVSHTTRPPRINNGVAEENGVDYYFIDDAEAMRMLAAGEFIEAKEVYTGTIYGTSVAEFRTAIDQGRLPLTDIDIQGAIEYQAISSSVVVIFILPPSFTAWRERMLGRYSSQADFETDWAKRRATAKRELETALSSTKFHFLINDQLDMAINQALKIIDNQTSESEQLVARKLAQEFLQKL